MDLVWAADPTLDTDRPALMAGLIPEHTKFSFQIRIDKFFRTFLSLTKDFET